MLNEYVPDVEKYFNAFINQAKLEEEKTNLELEYDQFKADLVKIVSTNSEFYINSKPPSMTYVNKTYLVSGYDLESKNKIDYYEHKLAELNKALLEIKGYIKKSEMELAIFQTLSANSRNIIKIQEDV